MRGEGEGDEDSLDGLFWSRRESADIPGILPLDDAQAFMSMAHPASALLGLLIVAKVDEYSMLTLKERLNIHLV